MHDAVDIDLVALDVIDDHIALRRDAAVFGIGVFGQLRQRLRMGGRSKKVRAPCNRNADLLMIIGRNPAATLYRSVGVLRARIQSTDSCCVGASGRLPRR